MGFFEKRYDAIRKRLGLKTVPGKKKFIIIQIDALSHEVLTHYIDKGGCRFLCRLLEEEGYSLQKYNCGIPSSTPAVQAGIMYGKNDIVPGFRYVDKKERRQWSFGHPNHVKHFEQAHFKNCKGILKDGSSYSNHFSGDAKRSILTMSTITKDKNYRRIRESSIWLFLFLHPASLFRVTYYSMAELVLEIAVSLSRPFMRLLKMKKGIYSFWIPFRRLLMNSILAELITTGVLLDIRRGVPRIYVNYMNFDDIAHLRGPISPSAYLMIRAIERRIKRIYKRAKGKYDVYIMSDHGQVPSVPFTELNGMTLAEAIEKATKVESAQLSSAHEGRLSMLGVAMKKTLGAIRFVSAPLRWIVTPFARGVLRIIRPAKNTFTWKGEKIVVSDGCAIAHVYFTSTKNRMNLSAIRKRFPKLVDTLVKNAGIGIVMAKQSDRIILLGKGGRIEIGSDVIKKGKDILSRFGDQEMLIRQIRDFDRYDHIGDLVLFGNYRNGEGVSFTAHVGAHGGIGGNMCWPFMMSSKKMDLSGVENARELYKIFAKYL